MNRPFIYRIAGNFRAVQNFAFFADWLICAKIKTTKKFQNDVTPGNTHAQGRDGSAEAISRVARKQSAKRYSYARFTRGILSPSLPRFHGNRYTASPLGVQARKLGARSGVGRARKYKPRKFLLEAPRANPRKYAPAKISRYTVLDGGLKLLWLELTYYYCHYILDVI